MSDWKYVMLSDETDGTVRLMPVIFPAEMVHKDVAEAMVRMAMRYDDPRLWIPRSAGFVQLMATSAHGESESLNLPSDPEDTRLINVRGYTGGVPSPMDAKIEGMLGLRHVEQMIARLKCS